MISVYCILHLGFSILVFRILRIKLFKQDFSGRTQVERSSELEGNISSIIFC